MEVSIIPSGLRARFFSLVHLVNVNAGQDVFVCE